MKRFVLIILNCLTTIGFITPLNAQNREPGRLFIALHSGIFISDVENYNEPYNDPYFLSLGGIAGFPMSKFSHIYVKGNYTSGEAYYTTYKYLRDPLTDEFVLESKSKGERYDRKQSLLNVGIQRSFYLKSEFYFFLNTGFSFTRFIEQSKESESRSEGKGFIGGFIGGGVEKKFFKNNFSIFSEGAYINTNPILSDFIGEQGGISFSFGIRFFLPHPKNAIDKP